MSPKAFLALSVATVIAVAAAGWSVAQRPAGPVEARAGEAFLPGLVARQADIARIEVTQAGATLVIARSDAGWVLADKGNFPARIEALRDAFAGLAQLTVLEAKTDNPERFDRLDVQDPVDGEDRSKRIVLKTAGGDTVADVIVGKTAFGVGGEGGLYVRTGGDNRSWLVQGNVRLPVDTIGWAEATVADVAFDRVNRVLLPGQVHVVRSGEDLPVLEALPEGRSTDPSKADRVFRLAERLAVEDIRSSADLSVPEDAPATELSTLDGLTLRFRPAEVAAGESTETWWTIQASGAGAEDLAARLDGFAFKLPDWKAEVLRFGRDDLLAAPTDS